MTNQTKSIHILALKPICSNSFPSGIKLKEMHSEIKKSKQNTQEKEVMENIAQ